MDRLACNRLHQDAAAASLSGSQCCSHHLSLSRYYHHKQHVLHLHGGSSCEVPLLVAAVAGPLAACDDIWCFRLVLLWFCRLPAVMQKLQSCLGQGTGSTTGPPESAKCFRKTCKRCSGAGPAAGPVDFCAAPAGGSWTAVW